MTCPIDRGDIELQDGFLHENGCTVKGGTSESTIPIEGVVGLFDENAINLVLNVMVFRRE